MKTLIYATNAINEHNQTKYSENITNLPLIVQLYSTAELNNNK